MPGLGKSGTSRMCFFRSSMLSSTFYSMVDVEALPGGDVGKLLLLDTGDPRRRRPLPQAVDEERQALRGAGGVDLDPPIGQVADLAGQAELAPGLAGEPAEPHPLHPPVDQQMDRPALFAGVAHRCP